MVSRVRRLLRVGQRQRRWLALVRKDVWGVELGAALLEAFDEGVHRKAAPRGCGALTRRPFIAHWSPIRSDYVSRQRAGRVVWFSAGLSLLFGRFCATCPDMGFVGF